MSAEIDLLKKVADINDGNLLAYIKVGREIRAYLDKEAAKQPEGTPCCQAPIVHYRSLNKKVCADCGQEFEWPLKEGQKPLIKHTR